MSITGPCKAKIEEELEVIFKHMDYLRLLVEFDETAEQQGMQAIIEKAQSRLAKLDA